MAGGRLSQILGHPKSVGQIYGYLFFASTPQSLDDISTELAISKASVSNGIRQLLSWGVARQVWVQGDRKEYFEVLVDVSTLFKAGYTDFVKPRVNSSSRRMKDIGNLLDEEHGKGLLGEKEYDFSKERLAKLKKIQSRLEKLLPILERLT